VSIVLSPEAWTGFKKCGCKREYYGLRIIAVSTLVKDDKGEEVKIRLLSAYAPHSGCTEVEKVEYESQLALAIESCGEDEILLVGSDTNASVGRRTAQQVRDDDDGVQSPVGAFGLEWSNAAGTRLASFVGLRQLCLPTTFFQKSESSIPTWYHPCNKKGYQLDHFIMKRRDLMRVVNAGTSVRHSVHSDHRVIKLKLRIARHFKVRKEKNKGRPSRDRLGDDETRKIFVQKVEEELRKIDPQLGRRRAAARVSDNGAHLRRLGQTVQATLQQALETAAKETLVETTRKNPGWFKANQTELLKSCEKRNQLQHRYNLDPTPHTRQRLRAHQRGHKKMVEKARRDWLMQRVSKINGNGGSFIGHYWKAVNDLVDGPDKTRKMVSMIYRDDITGKKAETQERSGEILVAHLTKLLNAVPAVDDDAIDAVKQRPVRTEMDVEPTEEEIKAAIKRQNSGKATGDSKIPAEYYQACLDSPVTYRTVEIIISLAWCGVEMPKEWVEGRIKMLPKTGDLLDPGRWRSITLLDAAAKIMSTILTMRLNKILKDDGIEMQNGFTPKRGTVDGSFSVRTLLKKRREHGKETWGYFLDLVKAFDTVPRAALMQVLAKFGVPPIMVKVIESMYTNCSVNVDVGETEYSISATAGVKQGDNLAPVLFLIYIQAVLETLDTTFPLRKKLRFGTKFDHILHGRLYNVKKDVTWFEIGESLYADDAFFGFDTRADLEEGAVLIDRHFTSFGLDVHRGKPGKKSKTECMFFPRQGESYDDADTSDIAVDRGFYSFTKSFKYLGSIISFDLRADADVAARIRSATGAFAKLSETLTRKSTKIKQRAAIYAAIVLSILTYGAECWSLREDLIQKLSVFHNQCVRAMCHVTRRMQHRRRIRTSELDKRVGLPPFREMLAVRQLRWLGHVARMEKSRAPRMLLGSFVKHPRTLGRPEQTVGHSFKKFLRLRARQIKEAFTPNAKFNFYPTEDSPAITIAAWALAAALERTSGAVWGSSTWLDYTPDRVLWRAIVMNRYGNVLPQAWRQPATNNPYDNILNGLPHATRRKKNKKPKLYALWTAALHPGGRKVRIDEIFCGWNVVAPMVQGVGGANYISAKDTSDGRSMLEAWLAMHRDAHGSRTAVMLTRTGVPYHDRRRHRTRNAPTAATEHND